MDQNCSDHEKEIKQDISDDKPMEKKNDIDPTPEIKQDRKPRAEHLPLGTGYEVEHLPTEVIKPEIHPLNDPIPDLVKARELEEKPLEDPVPSPEDEFYDFEKDIYGDEAEIKPEL